MIEQKEGSIVAVAWHDKRTVTILSTLSNPLEISSVKRRKRDGSQVDVPCPKAVQSYTAHMNGVDRADQLRSSYSVSRRAAKWWKYLFWFLIDISIINGFIMMKKSANHQVTSKTLRKKDQCQLHFRQNLVKQLIGDYRHKRKRESIQNKASEGLLHWPVILGKKQTCKQCSVRGGRREPTSGCEQCNINLCVDCFKPYHKAKFPALFK